MSAVHVPGVENVEADYYSRNFSDSSEWSLKRHMFDRLCLHFFRPDIDLFSSRNNRQLDRFVTWFPEPGPCFVDAFAISWNQLSPYIFPPFTLIGKVMNKIVQDQVDRALIVCVWWPSQPWFPMFLEQLCDFPVRLPRHRDLLVLRHSGQLHPLGKRLKILAAVVSGVPSRIRDFRVRLRSLSSGHGHLEPGSSTSTLGKSGICGTISSLPVPFKPLKRL